jgi:hypothetical protein
VNGRTRVSSTDAALTKITCIGGDMADRKGKSSRKRRTRHHPSFSEVKGKIVHDVEVSTTDYGCAIGIMFQDRTYLCFEVETTGVIILPDLSDWKTGNYKPLKRWPSVK